MLLMQFTLRRLLLFVTVCGFVCFLIGLAVRGSHIPQGMAVAIGSVVASLAVFANVFLITWIWSLLGSGTPRERLDPALDQRLAQKPDVQAVVIGDSPFAQRPVETAHPKPSKHNRQGS